MPTSSSYILTPVVSFTSWLDPQSVLDVGCGYGQWGILLRQHIDYPWEIHAGIPRWNRRIDGNRSLGAIQESSLGFRLRQCRGEGGSQVSLRCQLRFL